MLLASANPPEAEKTGIPDGRFRKAINRRKNLLWFFIFKPLFSLERIGKLDSEVISFG
jgi:hypothetical protein